MQIASIYKIDDSSISSEASNFDNGENSSAQKEFNIEKTGASLSSIRAQNSFLQDLISSFFDEQEHDQSVQKLDSIREEFKSNKIGLHAFLQLFSQSYLQTKLEPRSRYIDDFFLSLRNLILYHFDNDEIYHIFSSSVAILKALLILKILKLDLHIAEHLRNLDDEDKCYLYDQITEFKDIILNGTTIHSQTNFLKHDERREYWASMNDLNTILAHDDLDDFKQYLSKHPCNHIKHPYFKYEFALNYSDTQLPGLQIIDYAAYSNAISIFHYLYELGNTSDYMADYAIAGNANRIVAFLAELKYHKLKISRYQVHRCYNFQFLDFLREKAIVNSELNFNFLKTWLDAKNFYLFTPNFLKINFESDANLNDLIFGIFSTECIPYIHFLHENNLLPEKPNLSRLVFLLNEVIQAGHTISFTILIEKYESLLFPSYLSDILQQSCRFGQFYMVKMLLAYGKNVIDFGFNSDPTFDGTPLHVACLKGYLSIMELLLGQQGIPINSVDSQGNTPLHIALHSGSINIVKLLLQQEGIDINQPNHRLETPFHYALRYMSDEDDSTIAELFLTFPNLNVNARTHIEDETPLIYSMHSRMVRVVKLLLDRPDINLDIPEYDDQSLLEIAEELEDETIIQLMIDKLSLDEEKEENAQISQEEISEMCSHRTKRKDRTPHEIIIRDYHYGKQSI